MKQLKNGGGKREKSTIVALGGYTSCKTKNLDFHSLHFERLFPNNFLRKLTIA